LDSRFVVTRTVSSLTFPEISRIALSVGTRMALRFSDNSGERRLVCPRRSFVLASYSLL